MYILFLISIYLFNGPHSVPNKCCHYPKWLISNRYIRFLFRYCWHKLVRHFPLLFNMSGLKLKKNTTMIVWSFLTPICPSTLETNLLCQLYLRMTYLLKWKTLNIIHLLLYCGINLPTQCSFKINSYCIVVR